MADSSVMEHIVSLCKRRGFIYPASEIYGGINGFWDYGPLGTELKRNLKNAWWRDIVQTELIGPDGAAVDIVGLDTTIITHPKVWEASGHVAGFNDPMVDDKETKQRFRADHLYGAYSNETLATLAADELRRIVTDPLLQTTIWPIATIVASSESEAASIVESNPKLIKPFKLKERFWHAESNGRQAWIASADGPGGTPTVAYIEPIALDVLAANLEKIPSPFSGKFGTLTEPRQFNLMFVTFVGAIQNDEAKAYLRPETAQGIFINFWNVIDTSRVKVPFGIAQQGKAFRNEVTPRNFTFRSREFEQMEIEFFIHPSTANEWYKFWRDQRFNWWQSIGLAGSRLRLRAHEKDELAHYAKEGAGTSDIEYQFPFTSPGFGELEGVAHRADFDLKAHATTCGKGDKMMYFDQDLQVKLQNEGVAKEEIQKRSRYFPHVIEPSAGADRGTLALICEAYTPDPARPSGVVMKFHPRMAPVKAGIFPLVNKDGLPEIGEKLYRELRRTWVVEYDAKQSIGKRYARMDEAGTPFCFTIDSETLKDNTVTVRHRDTLQQERIGIDNVAAFMAERIQA